MARRRVTTAQRLEAFRKYDQEIQQLLVSAHGFSTGQSFASVQHLSGMIQSRFDAGQSARETATEVDHFERNTSVIPIGPRYGNAKRLTHPYDNMVSRPELRVDPLAKRYVRELKAIGPGTKVEVLHASSSVPRGWDYGNYTELSVILRDGETHKVSFKLNVASGECSGIAFIDPDTRMSVPVQARTGSPEETIAHMVSEVRHHLRPRHGNAYWGPPPKGPTFVEEFKKDGFWVTIFQYEDGSYLIKMPIGTGSFEQTSAPDIGTARRTAKKMLAALIARRRA